MVSIYFIVSLTVAKACIQYAVVFLAEKVCRLCCLCDPLQSQAILGKELSMMYLPCMNRIGKFIFVQNPCMFVKYNLQSLFTPGLNF
jgi:hypothetical protein